MAIIKKHHPGEFCWTDLGAKNVTRAKRFYQGLFGWTVKEFPMGKGDFKYSMMRVRGKDVGALYPMPEEQRKLKAPPFWLPYVSVKSAARTARKAGTAGGTVCLGPMEVADHGRMAIIRDPTGAGFAIWQAAGHSGAQLNNTPGTVCWHDLSTPRTAAAGKFYAKVFGWTPEKKDFSGKAYHLFTVKGEGVGGMWPEPMKKLPPTWITYWQVANCAKSVAKAKRLGGGVLMGTTSVPAMCRFAILKDPQGAVFGLLEPN
jgi:predicted enzyme related to lactoylglutathione lyase